MYLNALRHDTIFSPMSAQNMGMLSGLCTQPQSRRKIIIFANQSFKSIGSRILRCAPTDAPTYYFTPPVVDCFTLDIPVAAWRAPCRIFSSISSLVAAFGTNACGCQTHRLIGSYLYDEPSNSEVGLGQRELLAVTWYSKTYKF